MIETIAALGYPADYAQYLERAEAETRSGCRLPSGGWWFSGAGWMRPPSLIAAQLAAAGTCTTRGAALTPHFGTAVHAIIRSGESRRALGADGTPIATAPVLVLANSTRSKRRAASSRDSNSVLLEDPNQFWNVGGTGGDFLVDGGE